VTGAEETQTRKPAGPIYHRSRMEGDARNANNQQAASLPLPNAADPDAERTRSRYHFSRRGES
jgi:hypothetical protein